MKEGPGRRQDPGRQGGERAPCQDMLSSGPPSPVAGPLLVSLFLLHFDSGDEVAGAMLSAAGRAECAESQWSCSVSSALFLSICPSVLAFSLLYFLVPLPFNHICFKFPVSEFLSLMVLALALSPQIVFFAFEYAL